MPQAKNKKILIYFFLFLMIGTFNNKNLNFENLIKIKKVSIEGLDDVNNFQLKNDLKFLDLKNLLFLNKIKISKVIEKNNLIENYTVFKRYPSTLNIEINKTIFLAQLKKDDQNFILGNNRKLIEVSNTKTDLPFIFGDFKIINFFDLKKAIDQTNLNYYEIRNFFFFKSGRWDIETKDGLLIKLPKNEITKSLRLLLSFLNENSEKKINKIDLRQHNQIIINE